MKTIFAKPAEGLLVRKEDVPFNPINPDGEVLPSTTYYQRRLIAGDLVEIDRPLASSGDASAEQSGKEN